MADWIIMWTSKRKKEKKSVKGEALLSEGA